MRRKTNERSTPVLYRIRLQGRLDPQWNDWFEGMAITNRDEETWMTGPVTDQSALHGLLNRIRDLNLVLIGLERIRPDGELK